MRINQISFQNTHSTDKWMSIGDQVMGGTSHGRMRFDEQGFAVFEGNVSLENGGGFASVRHADVPLGTATTTGYRLRVRGDGKQYKLNLGVDRAFDSVQYQASFNPGAAGQSQDCVEHMWVDIELPLACFEPRFRGRAVPGQASLDPERVCHVGLMVADRQAGPFRLEIQEIVCI